jgi:ATP-binding cassette subfamily B protein
LFEQVAADSRSGRADGRITLLISHRFSTVRMADLIVVLEEGRVTQQGTHDELLAQGGLYAELYELQARAYR